MVTITVTDVNEAPTVMGAASIDHAENGTELDVDAATDQRGPSRYTPPPMRTTMTTLLPV